MSFSPSHLPAHTLQIFTLSGDPITTAGGCSSIPNSSISPCFVCCVRPASTARTGAMLRVGVRQINMAKHNTDYGVKGLAMYALWDSTAATLG